jgi:hypothetical protein
MMGTLRGKAVTFIAAATTERSSGDIRSKSELKIGSRLRTPRVWQCSLESKLEIANWMAARQGWLKCERL